MMQVVVTGAAGFVGSNVVDRLLQAGNKVVGFDNFSTGREEFLKHALDHPRFTLHRQDLLNIEALKVAVEGADLVIHLAANADVRFGTQHPTRDLQINTIGTSNVLEAMRVAGVHRIAFASTGSVYGEPAIFPTAENAPFPLQTSLYGASKLAAESLIQAYSEGFGFESYIFRFVSILGERYTHGHVFDFYKQLRTDPGKLNVLGNGLQKKSYLYIQDCIDGILTALDKASDKVNIFNLGTDEYCQVNDSIRWITSHLRVTPEITYTGGERGWIGDSPFIFLDCSKIRALGWKPALSIESGIGKTLVFLGQHDHLLENRE